MDIRKIAAGAATAGLLGMGGLGLGAGIALADPPSPNPGNGSGNAGNGNGNPGNGNQGNGNPGNGNQGDDTVRPPWVTGPGVNVGEPGNPAPPGLNYLPPPGHGGPMPQDRIFLPEVPGWVLTPVVAPEWAPPLPELPDWADDLTVVWNPELNAWGVWDAEANLFVRL